MLKVLSGNEILNKMLTSGCYKCAKMLCNSPNIDLVNINAFTKMVLFKRFVLKILRGVIGSCKERDKCET